MRDSRFCRLIYTKVSRLSYIFRKSGLAFTKMSLKKVGEFLRADARVLKIVEVKRKVSQKGPLFLEEIY